MKTEIYHRLDCQNAPGLCVVIDVIRAFTTSAFAFSSGARDIILVSTIEDAFQRYERDNSLFLMGEEYGDPIEGFHFGNSPTQLKNAILDNRTLVQRTSSGTQGVYAVGHADRILLSSFVVAEATLRRIHELKPDQVSFIVTGTNDGSEDYALAEYLQQKLICQETPVEPFINRVNASISAKRMVSPEVAEYQYGHDDLKCVTDVDRFPFAMEVFKTNSTFIARKI
jgi:2-phosphosulfolactate phosphatase